MQKASLQLGYMQIELTCNYLVGLYQSTSVEAFMHRPVH